MYLTMKFYSPEHYQSHCAGLKPEQRLPLQIMKTDSKSFESLIKFRKNRTNSWFVCQHNYIDVCSVSVPVRLGQSLIDIK